jgi:hypothetical protein
MNTQKRTELKDRNDSILVPDAPLSNQPALTFELFQQQPNWSALARNFAVGPNDKHGAEVYRAFESLHKNVHLLSNESAEHGE